MHTANMGYLVKTLLYFTNVIHLFEYDALSSKWKPSVGKAFGLLRSGMLGNMRHPFIFCAAGLFDQIPCLYRTSMHGIWIFLCSSWSLSSLDYFLIHWQDVQSPGTNRLHLTRNFEILKVCFFFVASLPFLTSLSGERLCSGLTHRRMCSTMMLDLILYVGF